MAVKMKAKKETTKTPQQKLLSLEQQTEAAFSLESTDKLKFKNAQFYTFYLNLMVFCPRELTDKEKREWKIIRKILRKRNIKLENMKGNIIQCKINNLKKSYGL